MNLHANAVALDGKAVLILGPSGSGKSTLALAMMAQGAQLIADDRVRVWRAGPALMAGAPGRAPALIEARGVGLLHAALARPSPVALVVDLGQAEPARLPRPRNIAVLGVELPLVLGPCRPHLESALRQLILHGRADPDDALHPGSTVDTEAKIQPSTAEPRMAVSGAQPPVAPARAEPGAQRVVLVSGPSGAGRSTAIAALEDLGFEAIDNLPLSLVPRLLDGPDRPAPLALGLDVRNRDFSAANVIHLIDSLTRDPRFDPEVLYLDCATDSLIRRYAETRRRHPLALDGTPTDAIEAERNLLTSIRGRADVLIDTTELTPHDLRAELAGAFGVAADRLLSVSVQSFSYKRGVPRGLDMMFDCRFLANPHWVRDLRSRDGRDPQVQAHVIRDPRFDEFFQRVRDLILFLLPAQVDEGKAHLAIGFGCTGGQHRSVTLAELMAEQLAQQGWRVSKRHRELERHAAGARLAEQSAPGTGPERDGIA